MARFESSPHFAEEEKNVLRLAAALTRTPANVDEALFAALRKQFSKRQLVELSAVIAWENFRARSNRTFGIEAEGFSKGQFCPLPEQQEKTAAY
jgi:alkylhydroperoxidase family enzyme